MKGVNNVTMKEFVEKVCKKALNGFEPDSCSGCPYGSYDGVCQHPEHPKNNKKEEKKCKNY